MRILIADDNPDIRCLISRSLIHVGRCDLAENGLAAVEMFRQADAEHDPYALITMDCQMPILDGFGAISMIRAFEAAQKRIRLHSTICIISADDNCLQRHEDKNGPDDNLHYLRKPFFINDLYVIARTALGRLRSSLLQSQSFPQNTIRPSANKSGRQFRDRNV